MPPQGHLELISVICNPGLKSRHWDQLSEIVGFDLKPDSGTTLKKMLRLHLKKYIEEFNVVGSGATKVSVCVCLCAFVCACVILCALVCFCVRLCAFVWACGILCVFLCSLLVCSVMWCSMVLCDIMRRYVVICASSSLPFSI